VKLKIENKDLSPLFEVPSLPLSDTCRNLEHLTSKGRHCKQGSPLKKWR